MSTLEVRGLAFHYGSRRLICDVSFEARSGDFICVLGPNGSGKSTLLRLLTGFMRPHGGAVLMDGEDLSLPPASRLARLVAYVPSETVTPYDFTVRETVLLGRTSLAGFWRGYSAEDCEAADRAIGEAGITALAGRSINSLSSGERQLVFIAQALAQEARLMLLDEPTSHLDLRYKAEIMGLLSRLAAKGIAVMAVLHEPALAELGCNKVLLLGHGGMFRYGLSKELLTPSSLSAIYGLPENSPLLKSSMGTSDAR